MSVGWYHPLLDQHDFRQTQTAISTYYILKNGFSLAYETPVLGFPWSIPMEFPLYQGIVALLVKIFNSPIDQTGRFVSIFFFYLSLFPIYYILYCLNIARTYRWIFLSLFLASPIYLFWSRTFMIESTALFFSLAYLGCVGLYFRRRDSPVVASLASVFAILSGLTKITTLAGFMMIALVWTLIVWKRENRSQKLLKNLIIPAVAFFIIPYIANKLWIDFADFQKGLNLMTVDSLTSKSVALKTWNFGTLEQKLSLRKWASYLYRTFRDTFGGAVITALVITILPLFTKRVYRLFSFGSSLLFLGIVAIFTNLHFVHNYYPYANGILLIFALGFTITGLLKKQQKLLRFLGLAMFFMLLIFQLHFYKNNWYAVASNPYSKNEILQAAKQAKEITSLRGVLLIQGEGWSSSIPYYSERKALMNFDYSFYPLEGLQGAMKSLSDANYKVETLIICNRARKSHEKIKSLLNRYHFNKTPSFSNRKCDIYSLNSENN